MKFIIKENTWLTRRHMDFGWGNGYVVIPKGHKLNGLSYDDDMFENIDVHGGLTYSNEVEEDDLKSFPELKEDIGSWVVGFDTCHFSDTLASWNQINVLKETKRLLKQLKAL